MPPPPYARGRRFAGCNLVETRICLSSPRATGSAGHDPGLTLDLLILVISVPERQVILFLSRDVRASIAIKRLGRGVQHLVDMRPLRPATCRCVPDPSDSSSILRGVEQSITSGTEVGVRVIGEKRKRPSR